MHQRFSKILNLIMITLFSTFIGCGEQNTIIKNNFSSKQLELSFISAQTGEFNIAVYRKTKASSNTELHSKISSSSKSVTRDGNHFVLLLDEPLSQKLNSGDCFNIAIEKNISEQSEKSAESCL